MDYHAYKFFTELYTKIKNPTSETEVGYHFGRMLDNYIFHPIYCFRRGTYNLFTWFKVIWKLDSYDHFYLIEIIDKQLKEMEDFWCSGNTCTAGAVHKYKRIKWTRKLIQMHLEEHYTMKEFDESRIVTKLIHCGDVNDYDRNKMKLAHEKDEKVWKLAMKNLSRLREWWD